MPLLELSRFDMGKEKGENKKIKIYFFPSLLLLRASHARSSVCTFNSLLFHFHFQIFVFKRWLLCGYSCITLKRKFPGTLWKNGKVDSFDQFQIYTVLISSRGLCRRGNNRRKTTNGIDFALRAHTTYNIGVTKCNHHTLRVAENGRSFLNCTRVRAILSSITTTRDQSIQLSSMIK